MAKTIFANANTKVIAVLAVMLAASLALTTQTSNAYAYKTEYNENGQRHLNGHVLPGTHSTHAEVLTEVFMCTWFRADNDPRCDLSWIPADLIDWLKSTNNYRNGNLWILNE